MIQSRLQLLPRVWQNMEVMIQTRVEPMTCASECQTTWSDHDPKSTSTFATPVAKSWVMIQTRVEPMISASECHLTWSDHDPKSWVVTSKLESSIVDQNEDA